MANFKHGSIVRIELENFMIYRHIEFRPGPFLNLILGPNGSGKSALVCSIILGFAGDPQVTGRSSNLIDYVRFGAQVASIIIEIFSDNPAEENYVIQRELKVVNKGKKNECTTSWKLNGQSANKTTVVEFIKKMNIDINNLCQILPQERVVEFSRMSPRELLFSTEKSIGNVDMYAKHMELISLSEVVIDLEKKLKENRALVLKCQNFKTNIEPDLKLINQKKKFEEEIEWLLKKQVWLEFEEKRIEYTQIKDKYTEKKKELEAFEKRVKPLKSNIMRIAQKLSEIQKEKSNFTSVFAQHSAKLSSTFRAMDDYHEKINQLVTSYAEEISERKKAQSRLTQYEQDYNNYKNDLMNYPKPDQFSEEAKKLETECNSIENEIKKLIRESITNKNQLNSYLDEKRYLESRKQDINDLFNQRMEKVNQKNSNTKTAYEWLQKNRDKFSGNVFPPLITQINVKKHEYANYVEAAIGPKDLSTFLFEKTSDLEMFSKAVKSQFGWRVNTAMIPKDIDRIKNEAGFDVEQFKSFGIFASVCDLFTAPNQVMAYLIKSYRINQIPVGNNITDQKITELINSSEFKKIITNKNVYSIMISSYDGEKTTRINAINPAKYLNIIINKNENERIVNDLSNLEQLIEKIKSTIETQEEQVKDLKENQSQKSQELNKVKSKINEMSKIESKIKERERQINQITQFLSRVEKAKDVLSQKLHQIHGNQLKLLEKIPGILNEFMAKSKLSATIESQIKIVKTVKVLLESQLLQIKEKEKSFQSVIQELSNELNKVKKIAQEYRQKAKNVSGFDFNENTDQQIKDKFDEMPPTLTEVIDSISMLKMRCEGIGNVDNSLLEEYKKYQREIEEKSAQISEIEKELESNKHKIDQLKPVWVEALEDLVSKINSNFSSFMNHMAYSGEVYLFKGHKEYDFDSYGIRIKVKFRDAEPMKDLDAYHQSGGERSVSTMIYMLSLQELAHVPFRVVDEINQGMDEKNERHVFDLITEVSRKNSSQYFLLSPKLLTNLNYTPEMKIHVIFNGPYCYVNWTEVLNNFVSENSTKTF